MLKIKSWPKLIFSIILAQSAGGVGTLFTFSAIPTWYAFLNKPVFSPPNWLFGPVWTILYTLIGISLYLIWTNKKGTLKLFLFHLFLNAIWSPIFFGAKNLGLAFIVILVMDVTLITIIKNFYKINKIAGLILIPYLMWISFASLLNFSIWRLNPNNSVNNIFAQELSSDTARKDYVFSEDNYKNSLSIFNLKKGSYSKNPTLSIKEEARIALLDLLIKRVSYKKSYLTFVRSKVTESKGLNNDEKGAVYSKIDPEVLYYENRAKEYTVNTPLEDLISKSKEEDAKYETVTLPVIYFALGNLSLGDVINLRNENTVIYKTLRTEAENLVKLGRADQFLFDRWFKDIDLELNKIIDIESMAKKQNELVFDKDTYKVEKAYEDTIEAISPAKSNLLQLNQFIKELEITISEKR
jgi:tryptophan-rich sensory protein